MPGVRVARVPDSTQDRPNNLRLALALAALAGAVPFAGWLFWALVLRLGPNDFHDYWLAGRLLLEGHSPYDTAEMAALAAREHLSFTLGGGYSYPLPFALVMVPFAALPFDVAVVAFNLISLVAFGATVAAWLLAAHPAAEPRRLAVAAVISGLFPPVYGTLAMGQANLILLPLMAGGAWLALGPARRPAVVGGVLVGLAAVVKLVPGALVVPLAIGRRWAVSAGLVGGAVASMVVAAVIAPWALADSTGLASNLDPDPFYTNQSLNGFVSRLVLDSSKGPAILPGAFDPRPVMLGATVAFGVATLAILWIRRRSLLDTPGLAHGLAFALVAGTIAAPKTSFWNESTLLVAAGIVIAVGAPDLRFGRLGRLDLALLWIWFGSSIAWALVWAFEPPATGSLSAVVNLAWSSSLFGMLALWLMLAGRLVRPSADQAAVSSTIS